MFRSILVAVDMAQAQKATPMIETARLLLGGQGRIILCNVVETISVYELPEFTTEMQAGYVREARERLSDIARDAGVETDVDVRLGHAANTIIDIARERAVDAIVLGSHKPGLQDYFLGSTAGRVVRHAHCSVLVLR